MERPACQMNEARDGSGAQLNVKFPYSTLPIVFTAAIRRDAAPLPAPQHYGRSSIIRMSKPARNTRMVRSIHLPARLWAATAAGVESTAATSAYQERFEDEAAVHGGSPSRCDAS